MAQNTIYGITSDREFEKAAIDLFRFQAENCIPYKEYLGLIGVKPSDIASVKEIPFLPIEFFKTHKVYCGESEPEIVFTSSSTGGEGTAKHYMARLDDYEKAFLRAFTIFYGAPEEISIYALLPNYLEREGSSLVYMADNLIKRGGSGFYLNEYEKLINDMSRDNRPKILLGVSYALWDLAEKYAPKLQNTIVMETGGMKGRREELPKADFHKILCDAFGVAQIHSEYGMAELSSQAYSYGKSVFMTPPWMRILIRDTNDPFEILPLRKNGGINIIDLANHYSCAFIQTQDLGVLYEPEYMDETHTSRPKTGDLKHFDHSLFSILGRIDRSEIRGCNLLVQ